MRVSTISTYFLAAVFSFTGLDKLLHYKGFIVALSSYVIVPEGTAEYLALPVIICEVWIAMGLLIKPWRQVASLVGSLALAIFTIALVVNYVNDPKAICGCWFSITLGTSSLSHIFLNLTLLGLAIIVWLDSRSKNQKLSSGSDLKNARSPSKLETEIGGVV